MDADGFVPYKHRVGFLLHGVPEPHQQELASRARDDHTSVANVVCQTLADRYGIPFTPSKRAGVNGAGETMAIKFPPAVLDAVRDEATDRAVTMRTVILDALSFELGLEAPSPTSVDPGKRPGRPRTEGRR